MIKQTRQPANTIQDSKKCIYKKGCISYPAKCLTCKRNPGKKDYYEPIRENNPWRASFPMPSPIPMPNIIKDWVGPWNQVTPFKTTPFRRLRKRPGLKIS